jgi:hypothetical protein
MDLYTLDLARDRGEQLRAEAARDSLARLVACCRPSSWRRVLRELDGRVRRSRVCCV